MKKTITAIAAMMLVATAGAQDTQQQDTPRNTSHYITLDFGGGFQNLVYSLDNHGKREPGMGIMGRIGYRYFFSKHWGAGINGVYKQSTTTAKITEQDVPADGENVTRSIDGKDGFLFFLSYNNLKERQKQTSIAIPVGLYFQGNMTDKWKMGFGLGISMQFVNKESVEFEGGDITAYAKYKLDNVSFANMPNHNLPMPKSDFSCSYDYKTSFGVFAELNFMYALARWVDLNIGIYGGYGLSKATKSSSHPVYDYQTESNNHYYGALNSNVTNGSNPLAIGMMAGFRFKIGKNKAETKPEDDDNKPEVVVDNNKPQEDKKDEEQKPEVKPEENQVVENQPEENQPSSDDNGQVVNITDIVNTNPADNQTTKPAEPKKDQNKVYTEKGKEVYINGKKYVVVDTIRMIINFELGESGNPDITVVDQTLDDVAKYLKEHPDYKLSIVGHTCDLGPDATNQRIGLARANTVKQEFIKRGIPSSRLLTSTKAATQPLVPNTSDQNRSRNRRVELEYVK